MKSGGGGSHDQQDRRRTNPNTWEFMHPGTKVRNTKEKTSQKKNKSIDHSQEVQKENDIGIEEVKRHEGYPKTRLKMN